MEQFYLMKILVPRPACLTKKSMFVNRMEEKAAESEQSVFTVTKHSVSRKHSRRFIGKIVNPLFF